MSHAKSKNAKICSLQSSYLDVVVSLHSILIEHCRRRGIYLILQKNMICTKLHRFNANIIEFLLYITEGNIIMH